MEQRFTLKEANEAVPLLASIAREIEERRAELRELHRQHAALEKAQTPEGLDGAIADLEARLHEVERGLRDALTELKEFGAHVLRMTPLTVHLPGRTRNKDIVFCWQVGETQIDHGHPEGHEEDPRRPLQIRLNHTTREAS